MKSCPGDNPFRTLAEDCKFDPSTALYIVAVAGQLWDGNEHSAGPTRLLGEIRYWIHKNIPDPNRFYHEPTGDWTGFGHRFYFRDKNNAISFHEAVPSFGTNGWFFDDFDDFLKISMESVGLGGGIALDIEPHDYDDERVYDMWEWCRDNLKNKIWYSYSLNIMFFEKEEDLLLFQMKFHA